MEQEFDVEIKEVLSRVQKVKAESLDDAINKANLWLIMQRGKSDYHRQKHLRNRGNGKRRCIKI